MVSLKRFSVYILLLFSILSTGCGQSASQAILSTQKRQLVGHVRADRGLTTSRLQRAGCVQVVRTPSGDEVVEFASQECPSAGELTAEEAIVFSASLVRNATLRTSAQMIRADIPLGTLSLHPSSEEEKFEVWSFDHFCQISDPSIAPDPFFNEICEVVFASEDSERAGRYEAIRVIPLEVLARNKISEREKFLLSESEWKRRAAESESLSERVRRDRDKAWTDRQEAQESLAEAQRGVRDSMASNMTVRRTLERSHAQAELDAALKEVRYLELSVRFAKGEQQRATFLKERMDASEEAKRRDTEIESQISAFNAVVGDAGVQSPSPETSVTVAPAIDEPKELKLLRQVQTQNRQWILAEDARKKMEEEMTFALAESKQLAELENEKLPAALGLVIRKKDALNKIDRLPAQPGILREESDVDNN
jgi:hypothetical protein